MVVNWFRGSEIETGKEKIGYACLAALPSFGLTVLDWKDYQSFLYKACVWFHPFCSY